jgi:hypothetical protein
MMDKPHRFAQLYGYAVCLVAVVVGLISGNNVIEAAFDLSDPAHASWGGRDVPSTFEEYRAEQRQMNRPGDKVVEPGAPSTATSSTAPPASDDELRKIYDAKKADMIATQVFHARRSLASSALLLLASMALFAWHWRWLRGLRDDTSLAATT